MSVRMVLASWGTSEATHDGDGGGLNLKALSDCLTGLLLLPFDTVSSLNDRENTHVFFATFVGYDGLAGRLYDRWGSFLLLLFLWFDSMCLLFARFDSMGH